MAALAVFAIVSCEKPGDDLRVKLSQLEKQAREASERQRQLEYELVEQRFAAEMEAIERERTLIEEERREMEEDRKQQDAALVTELEQRSQELAERERLALEAQEELDARKRELTGLEERVRDMKQAGREPINSLPSYKNVNYGQPTGDFDNFYEPLQSYGSWFNTSDYGYVYQPTVVRDISWRPYTRGRWAFTNHGWTWVSNEPFGWACYHYGRWALLRNIGWVWIPGDEWAPAWVTWRESPGHIGWAPLPPETLAWRDRSWGSSVEVTFGIGSSWFSFVSYEHFGNNIHSHYLPVARNVTIFYQTTNITHYHINDGQVFVGGPSYLYVCDRIGETFPVHNLKLNQDPVFSHQLSNHFSGQDLEVVAPLMDADWNTALRPESIAKDLGEVSVERSSELSDDVRERFRESRATEAVRGRKAMANVGGHKELQRVSRRKLEENREQVRLAETDAVVEVEVPTESPVKVRPNRPGQLSREGAEDRSERPRGNRPVLEAPVISSSSPDPGQTPEPVISQLPDFDPQRNNPQQPPVVIPVPETAAGAESGEVTSQQAKRQEMMEMQEQRKTEEQGQRQRDRQERSMLHQQQQQAAELRRDLELRKSQEFAEQRKAQEEADRSAQQEQIRQQEEAVRRAQQENDQNAQLEESQRQQQEIKRQQEELQERIRQQKEEAAGRVQQEEAQRVQQEEMRRQEQQELIRQRQEDAARGVQQEEARRQQEDAQRRQQEEMRNQQEAAKRQQEEVARRAQQEEAQRARNEEAAERAQQEEAQRRQQQEAAQRAQQEEMRRQQEEARRQQEQQQERARQQQEEAQRRQQEEVQRRQQEDAQRRHQEEMRRQQQEDARHQQEQQQERARQQQEEAQRRQQEQSQ